MGSRIVGIGRSWIDTDFMPSKITAFMVWDMMGGDGLGMGLVMAREG